MKKTLYALLVINFFTLQCKKKVQEEIPDLSGNYYFNVNPAEVKVDSTTTQQIDFPRYEMEIMKLTDFEYKYRVTIFPFGIGVDSETYTGSLKFHPETKICDFDTFYTDDVWYGNDGNFTGKYDKSCNCIGGDIHAAVWLSLGVGKGRYTGAKTTFLLGKH